MLNKSYYDITDQCMCIEAKSIGKHIMANSIHNVFTYTFLFISELGSLYYPWQ